MRNNSVEEPPKKGSDSDHPTLDPTRDSTLDPIVDHPSLSDELLFQFKLISFQCCFNSLYTLGINI